MGKHGVGMPAALKLEAFGDLVSHAFDGETPYQVGSSLETTQWRDVDVRLMLDDETYAAQGYGDPCNPELNAKWCAMCRAFSALGRDMTGLPVDFQIQQRSRANEQHSGPRNALGIHSTLQRQVLCGISDDSGHLLSRTDKPTVSVSEDARDGGGVDRWTSSALSQFRTTHRRSSF